MIFSVGYLVVRCLLGSLMVLARPEGPRMPSSWCSGTRTQCCTARPSPVRNFWVGQRNKTAFQARLSEDLTQMFTLLAEGALTPRIAARMPLSDAAAPCGSRSHAPSWARSCSYPTPR